MPLTYQSLKLLQKCRLHICLKMAPNFVEMGGALMRVAEMQKACLTAQARAGRKERLLPERGLRPIKVLVLNQVLIGQEPPPAGGGVTLGGGNGPTPGKRGGVGAQ